MTTIFNSRYAIRVAGDGFMSRRRRTKKVWMDCLKGYKARKEVTAEITSNTEVWEKKIY